MDKFYYIEARARGVVLESLSRLAFLAKIKIRPSLTVGALSLSLFSAVCLNAASVKDFGAVGNGVQDDTVAIQNAISSTASGTLLFPAGTYKLTSPLTLLSNVTYQGQGTAVLTGSGYFWLVQTAYNGSNETINGLTFNNGGLLLQGTVTGLTLQSNTFQNLTANNSQGNWTLGNAIFAGDGGLRSSKISGNTFTNILINGSTRPDGTAASIDNSNGAMMFYGLDSTSIDHNTFDHVGEGIKVCFTNPYPSNNVYIGHNNFTNIHRMGMEIQGPYGCGAGRDFQSGPDTYNMVIEYNSLTNFLDPYWWTYPISLANPAPDGGSGAIVRYNYIVGTPPSYWASQGTSGNYGYGMELADASMQVYGNTIEGIWGYGITYDGSPNSTIHDNYLCGLEQGAEMIIHWETGASSNVTIANNTVIANACPANAPNPITPTAPPPPPPTNPPTGPITDGLYGVQNGVSGYLLDDPGFSVTAVQVIQWSANGGANQRWKFTSNGAGYYTIANGFSGLYLADSGNKLVQALQAATDAQLWSLTASGGGYVIKNKATGRVMDDPNLSMAIGTGVISWTPNGGKNQVWLVK